MAVMTSKGRGCVSSLRLDNAFILPSILSAVLGTSAYVFAGWRVLISSYTAGICRWGVPHLRRNHSNAFSAQFSERIKDSNVLDISGGTILLS